MVLISVISRAYVLLKQPDKAGQALDKAASIGSEGCTCELAARLALQDLRLLDLSKQLQDSAAQAAAAAEVAQQYESAGDATKAAASYAECLAACTAASAAGHGKEQWLLRLLVQHVPAAVDVHLQLGDAAGARQVLSSFSLLLLASGRSAADECAVCYEQLAGTSAVAVLSCGHIFHRSCCNEWFGHRLFEMGEFCPECPLCRQVDLALQPSATALKALEEMQQYDVNAPLTDDSNDDDSSMDDALADNDAPPAAQGAESPAGSTANGVIILGGQADPQTMPESSEQGDGLLQQELVVDFAQEGEGDQVVMTEDQSDVDDCVSVASSSSLTNLAAIGAISIAFSSV
eukprot:gene4566-4821_t